MRWPEADEVFQACVTVEEIDCKLSGTRQYCSYQ